MGAILILVICALCGIARGQQNSSASPASLAKASAKKEPAQSQSRAQVNNPATASAPQPSALDPDTELQLIVRQAGNDNATLIKNLEDYLAKFPNSPRRAPIYRGILEAEMQLHNPKAALEYAEKVIAIQPDDTQSMYVAVTLLEKLPDNASRVRAVDYDTRLIDRVSKADPESRPQQLTLEEWQAGRNKFLMQLYVTRGRLQHRLNKDEDAVKDLTIGFRLLPNANAALALGEIAEESKHADEAIRQYATAFMLTGPDQGQEQGDSEEAPPDRESLRLRLGNLWKFTHDSNAGLGDILLSAYDHSREIADAEKPDGPARNKDLTDPLQFSLRRVDGSGTVKIAESLGKVVVLDFWTTWCAYCNKMESMLGDVRRKFAGQDGVVFLTVNADTEESLVGPFLQDHTLGGTSVFADGVAEKFQVVSIPTVLVLDKSGKVAYRTQGFAPDGFVDLAAAAITKASAAPAP